MLRVIQVQKTELATSGAHGQPGDHYLLRLDLALDHACPLIYMGSVAMDVHWRSLLVTTETTSPGTTQHKYAAGQSDRYHGNQPGSPGTSISQAGNFFGSLEK